MLNIWKKPQTIFLKNYTILYSHTGLLEILYIGITIPRANNLRMKDYNGSQFWKGSIHDQLAPMHGVQSRRVWRRKTAHVMASREQREKGGVGEGDIPFQGHPLVIHLQPGQIL